ncbi:MAG: LON peptidase substrate-binding domain-containing protein [Acidimicrobiia bacterium]
MSYVLPMFPLEQVYLPGEPLTLHVFEPRYCQMIEGLLSTQPSFGTVLIERGSEVGGGDRRSSVGTVMAVQAGSKVGDTRYLLACVATTRLRVQEWLPDDPFPRARVEKWQDECDGDCTTLIAAIEALCARSADELPVLLPTDPSAASFTAVRVAGLGSYDAYRALCAPGPQARLAMVRDALEELRNFPPSNGS